MRVLGITALLICLAGCNSLQTEAQRSYSQTYSWSAPTVVTTADVRLVTERVNPVTGIKVMCTEPSPDVAKALSSSIGVSASGTAPSGVAANASLSAAAASAAAELAGRSTALLGLRDGLYRACEAYANGIIGADAYALVLSRYGQLMVTLFLGQDISGTGVDARAQVKADALQPPGQQQPVQPAPKGGGSVLNMTEPSAIPVTARQKQLASILSFPFGVQDSPLDGDAILQLIDDKPPAGGSASPAAAAAAASDTAALTLGRLVEDYFNLDEDASHLILVACIADNDPTRYVPRDSSGQLVFNRFLNEVCPVVVAKIRAQQPVVPPRPPINPNAKSPTAGAAQPRAAGRTTLRSDPASAAASMARSHPEDAGSVGVRAAAGHIPPPSLELATSETSVERR
jgi:hypothetical protein